MALTHSVAITLLGRRCPVSRWVGQLDSRPPAAGFFVLLGSLTWYRVDLPDGYLNRGLALRASRGPEWPVK